MVIISDKEAVRRVKSGEIEYFSHIVTSYTKRIATYIRGVIFDQSEVEDIIQETFIQFYKYIHNFNEDKPILPYLYQIAKNEMRMYLRSKKKTVSLDDTIEIPSEPINDPQEVLELLETLPPDQKKALQLLYEGHSYQSVARILKRPLNTVRTLIRRARLQIKKKHDSA